eukprot:scaffold1866_cov277-Pinguiococcus_pyrenoidosus.AAC.13
MAMAKLSAEEYLAQTGVAPMLETLLTALLDYRPENALAFVAEHCRDLRQKTPEIFRSFRLLRTAVEDEEKLLPLIAEVFAALTRHQGVATLTLASLGKVLQQLAFDLPADQVRRGRYGAPRVVERLPRISWPSNMLGHGDKKGVLDPWRRGLLRLVVPPSCFRLGGPSRRWC